MPTASAPPGLGPLWGPLWGASGGVSGGASGALKDAARLAQAWAWAEGRLYEVLGAWVPSCESAACKIYFDACSQHHAWRSQLWLERSGLQASAAVGPRRAEEPLAALACLEDDIARLAAYCRVVLARSVVGYRTWQQACGPSADRPVVRALSFAMSDVIADWQDGESLLVALLDEGGDAGVQAGARAVALVEELVVVGLGQFG